MAKGQFSSARRNFTRGVRRVRIRVADFFRVDHLSSSYGPRFTLNAKDETFFYYIDGSYGKYFWDYLSELRKPFIFLDIGANQGLYTIGSALNPNLVRAYAFEPVAETYALLLKNLRLNRVESHCEAIMLAVSDRAGHADIAIKDGHSGVATLRNRPGEQMVGPVTSSTIGTIDRRGLDAVVGDRGVAIVVKIDVEGLEEVVLRELLSTSFADDVIGVFVEIDEEWTDLHQITTLLGEAAFEKFTRVGSGQHYDLLAARS
ncbi:MAG: FkbM family methyltransferase [Pontimonas sp.]